MVTLCALLQKTRRVWLFSAPLLPLAARLCCLPLDTLPAVNTFAAVLTSLEVLYVAVCSLSVPFHLAVEACREVCQELEVYRLVALGVSLWRQLAVPVLFLVFWLALFVLQICASLASLPAHQGLLFIILSRVAECCHTPYSLIGLAFTVSYLALGLLKLCKFYLADDGAFQNDHVMHRGVTEGMTLLLLALQTDLLHFQLLQRTFLLSVILFIVVTSTLQSMIEITDPAVLGLGASQNRDVWRHLRGVSMCVFLLIFPSFISYKIAHFFRMDFWLLILVSSCMLTTLQATGTLFIYSLFMVEIFRDTPVEKMDEIIYSVNAIIRVLEFLVVICVVAYGTWESIFGEWSWMVASIIIIHSYFNVWLRAQSGWRSFLLRRKAAKKISSLPRATQGQLQNRNDVCAICFQEMTLAVITHCGHIFHGPCLRKWFYVQDTCPLCHQPVRALVGEENPTTHSRAEEAAPAPQQEESPGHRGGKPAARCSTEHQALGGTTETGESSGIEGRGLELQDEEEEEWLDETGEVADKTPTPGSLQRELGAPAETVSGGLQEPLKMDSPPAQGSPGKAHSGDLGSKQEQCGPESRAPQSQGGFLATQGHADPDPAPARPAEESWEVPWPSQETAESSAAAGTKTEALGGPQQQAYDSLQGLGHTEDSAGSHPSFSPS